MLKRILLCFSLLLGMVLFAVYYECYFPVLLLAVSITFVCILPIFVIVCKNKISIKSNMKKNSFNKNEDIPVSFTINNSSMVSIGRADIILSIKNKSGVEKIKKLSVSLMSNSETESSFTISSKYCGAITVSVLGIRVYDYLSLFYKNIANSSYEIGEVLILPELYNVNANIQNNDSESNNETEVFSDKESGDDYSEVFEVREYEEGDKLHRIHWKLSSKYDEMMVKEYSMPLIENEMIFLELYMDKDKEEKSKLLDSEIETVFSISYYYLCNEYEHYICWYDFKNQYLNRSKIKTIDDLYYVIRRILNCTCYNDKFYTLEYHNNIFTSDNYSRIKCVTTKVNKELLEKLKVIKQESSKIILITNSKNNEAAACLDDDNIINIDCNNLKTNLEDIYI